MKTFDVFEYPDPGASMAVVVLQGAYYLGLPTTLIMPLYGSATELAYSGINPRISLNGTTWTAKAEQTGAVSRSRLGRHLGNVADQSHLLLTALDRLMAGY
jgi:mRNA-degrading endonuclease toxin of MazEF toxin-antitoxin module